MSASRRATIVDVAGTSGVGVGTVSRVLDGAVNVRETTRLAALTRRHRAGGVVVVSLRLSREQLTSFQQAVSRQRLSGYRQALTAAGIA